MRTYGSRSIAALVVQECIESGHSLSALLPDYLKKMLSEKQIISSGIFNWIDVSKLLKKIKTKKLISEIDNMALAGILSTQILVDLFINKSIPGLENKDLVVLDKIIID